MKAASLSVWLISGGLVRGAKKTQIAPTCVGTGLDNPEYLRTNATEVRAELESLQPMPSARSSKNDYEVVRRERVRQLFRMRLTEELTETGVLLFYRWLQKYHPELLLRKKRNDPYQHLRMELEGLYK